MEKKYYIDPLDQKRPRPKEEPKEEMERLMTRFRLLEKWLKDAYSSREGVIDDETLSIFERFSITMKQTFDMAKLKKDLVEVAERIQKLREILK